jgi:metal-sulfur cluster biosynthetic enzyme
MMLEEAKAALSQHFPGLSIAANLVWDPPWTPDMMTIHGRESLAM